MNACWNHCLFDESAQITPYPLEHCFIEQTLLCAPYLHDLQKVYFEK